MSLTSQNVSQLLRENALKWPQKLGCVCEDGNALSFSEMENLCCQNVAHFKKAGILPGMRVATFVKPGLDFVPVIFALFRIGAVPVFIDPGMSLRNMLQCIENSECQAMVGVPVAHVLKKLKTKFFRHIQISICLTNSKILSKILANVQLPKASHALELKNKQNKFPLRTLSDRHIEEVKPHQLATILFTSGSTGVPKGVEVTFGILLRQQELLRKTFAIGDNEIDLVVFPLFALFSAAWGITAVIPNMNPAHPSRCSGEKLYNLMNQKHVTHTSGSPAIWKNVLDFALTHKKTLPQLKRILMAGAPVSEKLIRGWRSLLEKNAHVYTPYGATEALPLSYISDFELMEDCFEKTRNGQGTCVGLPLENTAIRIIKISSEAFNDIRETETLAQGEIGEIIVKSEVVTAQYFAKPEANRLAKIKDSDSGSFWHRMGDLGYLDQQGRLWFCGRKDHMIKVQNNTELYPDQLEPIFNQLDGVTRTALVGIPQSQHTNASTPVLMVEMKRNDQIEKRLLSKAVESEKTKLIRKVLFVNKFPTDVRHNIKINRHELAETAKNQLRISPS